MKKADRQRERKREKKRERKREEEKVEEEKAKRRTQSFLIADSTGSQISRRRPTVPRATSGVCEWGPNVVGRSCRI